MEGACDGYLCDVTSQPLTLDLAFHRGTHVGIAVLVGCAAGRMVGGAEVRFGFPGHHGVGHSLAVQGDLGSPAKQHAATLLPGLDARGDVLGRERIGAAGNHILDRSKQGTQCGARLQFLGIEFAVGIGVVSAEGFLGNRRGIQRRHLGDGGVSEQPAQKNHAPASSPADTSRRRHLSI